MTMETQICDNTLGLLIKYPKGAKKSSSIALLLWVACMSRAKWGWDSVVQLIYDGSRDNSVLVSTAIWYRGALKSPCYHIWVVFVVHKV